MSEGLILAVIAVSWIGLIAVVVLWLGGNLHRPRRGGDTSEETRVQDDRVSW